MKFLRRSAPYFLFAVLVLTGVGVWVKQQAIADWFQLRNYQPSTAIAQLADQATMTPLAKHLLYVNHPQIEDAAVFNQHCTNKTEQTVVLGCYLGNRQGIYVFSVSQPELNGVEQVTTAHEMLHQAYDRLSSSERTRVDGLLEDYFKHNLTDQTIKDQMATYQKSEPNDMVNEMHSVFGTEVTNLPPALEQYYKQYFTNRSVVAGFYSKYQAAFNSRNQQIATYDAQLATQKQQIADLQNSLASQLQTLDTQKAQMDTTHNNGDIAAYNAMVPAYNQLVETYNAQLQTLRDKINSYNQLVAARNAIAVQEQQLQQDLSSQKLPSLAGQ